MNVLVITSYEDHKSGEGPTALVEMPLPANGMTEDDVFVAWMQKQDGYKDWTRKRCLSKDVMFAWHVQSVVRL